MVSPAVSPAAASPTVPRQLASEFGFERSQSTALVLQPSASPQDPQVLQQQLVSDSADREACQFSLVKVRRAVSFFRQQVQAIAEGRTQDATVQQLVNLTDALEQDVRATVASAGAVADVSPVRPSSQVMLPVAALTGGASPDRRGSYEAMRQTLQETQKRCESLHAQLQKETEANRELSRARTLAEDSSRKLSEQVNQQSEELTNLARQRLAAEEVLEDLRKRHRLEDDLREKDFQRKLAAAQQEADARCREMQTGLVDKLHATRGALDKVRRDFGRLRADHADSKRSVVVLNEVMGQLMVQTERSVLQRLEAFEKSSLENRIISSDATRDLELRIAAEHELRVNEGASWSQRFSNLSAERDQLQARLSSEALQLQSQLEEERRRNSQDRLKLEADLSEIRSALGRSESSKAAVEEEHKLACSSAADLKNQLSESASALAAARSSGEALQRELEEQRQRLTALSETAVASCREESRLAQGRLEERTSQAEERARRVEADLEILRTKSLASAEEAAKARETVAAELADTTRQLQDEQRRGEARRAEADLAAAEAAKKSESLQTEILELKASIEQAAKEAAASAQEAAKEREKLEAERHRLQDTLASQMQTAKESQEQYERWRESHVDSLRRVQDEGSSRTLALEREKDSCQAELGEAAKMLEATKAQLEIAEKDLSRLRSELGESMTHAQLAKQSTEKLEQEAAELKQRLSMEFTEVSTALENALQNEASLTAKLEEASIRHSQERQLLESEMQQLKLSTDMQVAEREQRLERLKADYEAQLRGCETRFAGEFQKEKAKADAVLRENNQLRHFMQEQKMTSSAGMSSLHSQLESHILRLQRHTDELRGEFRSESTEAGLRNADTASALAHALPPSHTTATGQRGSGMTDASSLVIGNGFSTNFDSANLGEGYIAPRHSAAKPGRPAAGSMLF
eukprot:TRINITY_DN25758_c0_g1_i1.p1 TRINITY_DN25758_c0_g1~~TRINITY_DN25758_c0_g1_i1.p1  ORF type:complete len:1019 (-),score=321.68 TRINITY_DN25758_c0_g1_i1:49-2844(-)